MVQAKPDVDRPTILGGSGGWRLVVLRLTHPHCCGPASEPGHGIPTEGLPPQPAIEPAVCASGLVGRPGHNSGACKRHEAVSIHGAGFPTTRMSARPGLRRRRGDDRRVLRARQLPAGDRHGRRRAVPPAGGRLDRRHVDGVVPGRSLVELRSVRSARPDAPLLPLVRRRLPEQHRPLLRHRHDGPRLPRRFRQTGDPFSGRPDPHSAGNGCIMRLAPVPMFFYPDATEAAHWAGESSRTTHGAPECVESCQLLAAMICSALAGGSKDDVLFGHGRVASSARRCARSPPGTTATRARGDFGIGVRHSLPGSVGLVLLERRLVPRRGAARR